MLGSCGGCPVFQLFSFHVVVTVHCMNSFVGWREQVGDRAVCGVWPIGRCIQSFILSNKESEKPAVVSGTNSSVFHRVRVCSL